MTHQAGYFLFSHDGAAWSQALTPGSQNHAGAAVKTTAAPRILNMQDEDTALFTLFAHSHKAREKLAEMIARPLVESPVARGRVTSHAHLNYSLDNPFEQGTDILRPISEAYKLTEKQVRQHLLETINPVFFLHMFNALSPCKPHEIIAEGWVNGSKYDGFSFVSKTGERQTWVSTQWVRRNKAPADAPACHP